MSVIESINFGKNESVDEHFESIYRKCGMKVAKKEGGAPKPKTKCC
jgi:hypothetical protein